MARAPSHRPDSHHPSKLQPAKLQGPRSEPGVLDLQQAQLGCANLLHKHSGQGIHLPAEVRWHPVRAKARQQLLPRLHQHPLLNLELQQRHGHRHCPAVEVEADNPRRNTQQQQKQKTSDCWRAQNPRQEEGRHALQITEIHGGGSAISMPDSLTGSLFWKTSARRRCFCKEKFSQPICWQSWMHSMPSRREYTLCIRMLSVISRRSLAAVPSSVRAGKSKRCRSTRTAASFCEPGTTRTFPVDSSSISLRLSGRKRLYFWATS
eukprot:m.444425 g.444425  ORF g.444425 m.444425 type:complete len:264 (+) comp56835_c0_seq3:1018-1809(+)